MIKDDLGNRMKGYENQYRISLPKKIPLIIRVDGRAFHTLTKKFDKPFDNDFVVSMRCVASTLLREIQNAKAVFVQSDEISILLDDRTTEETDAWFDNNLNKIISISSSIATREFVKIYKKGEFDARAFVIEEKEVANYFIWRQRDWNRNSVNMFARAKFTQKELNGKNTKDVLKMLKDINIDYDKIDNVLKNGTFFFLDCDKLVTEYNKKLTYDKVNELLNYEVSK